MVHDDLLTPGDLLNLDAWDFIDTHHLLKGDDCIGFIQIFRSLQSDDLGGFGMLTKPSHGQACEIRTQRFIAPVVPDEGIGEILRGLIPAFTARFELLNQPELQVLAVPVTAERQVYVLQILTDTANDVQEGSSPYTIDWPDQENT